MRVSNILSLSLRSLRYALPLAVIGTLVLAPIALYALDVAVPDNIGSALHMIHAVWILVALGGAAQLVLVGAAAPAVRDVAAGRRRSQLRALGAGICGLARAALPCATAIVAIAIGGLALAIPGVALLLLLSLTGASERSGLAEPLSESARIVRANLRLTILVVAAIVIADIAIAGIAYLVLVGPTPLAHKPDHAELVALREVVRVLAIGLVVLSPLVAIVLAAIHVDRATPQPA